MAKPYRFPLAGVHGAERRDIMVKRISFICRMRLRVILACNAYGHRPVSRRGAGGERDGLSLHYRQAPQHEDALMTLAQRLLRSGHKWRYSRESVLSRSNERYQ